MTFIQRHAYDFGRTFASLFWPFFGKRRKLSVENLLRAGITKDPQEADHIAKSAFCHFLGHICEALCVPGVVTKENAREHLDFSEAAPEAVQLLLERPEAPILIVSGHHGCWEAATNILSMFRPMIAIARVMDNKFLARWMSKHHFRGPVTIVNKNDGFREKTIRQWQETNAAMTILMDQFAYNGARVQFFGRPARTVTSAARLGIKYGYPIVVGSFVRVGPYRYGLVGGKPIVFSKETKREDAVQMLNDRLEAAIRAYPEQYLWMHKRWRDD